MIGWVVESLLATSLLMLLVLAVRGGVRRSFGSTVTYALWALPALRLVMPPLPGGWQVGAFAAPLLTASPQPDRFAEQVVALQAPIAVGQPVMMAQAMSLPQRVADLPAMPTAIAAAGFNWLVLIGALWAIGALVFLCYHAITYRRFCQGIKDKTRRRQLIENQRIELIESDAASGPLAFGIWRKVVAFPSDFAERYDSDERDLALAHELAHHARGDLVANWVALVVLGLHWFNPIAWRAFRAFRADQEMACDARVLAGKHASSVHAYGRAIVKSAHGGAVSAACHLHTINDLKGRLKMLSTTQKSRTRILAGAAGVFALTITALGMTASGTQAAERLRGDVGRSIGVDLAKLADAPRAPIAPLAPLAPLSPMPAQAPAAVDLPPSDAAKPPVPPAPPAAPADRSDPVVVIAPAGKDTAEDHNIIMYKVDARSRRGDKGHLNDRQVFVFKGEDGKTDLRRTIIIRDKNGKVTTETIEGIKDRAPTVSEGKCPDDKADGAGFVINEVKDGKRIIIMCRSRIDKMVADSVAASSAARLAMIDGMIDSKAIERRAYRAALDGLGAARAKMAAKGSSGAEALKAIDQAIAEVESDLAKLK